MVSGHRPSDCCCGGLLAAYYHGRGLYDGDEPNEFVAPIDPKAMFTVLQAADWDRWMRGTCKDVVESQCRYPADRTTVAVRSSTRPSVKPLQQRMSSLTDLGVDVVEAESGDAAWHLVEQDVIFDLLLSDVRMPGSIDGIELAQRVEARNPDAGIIIMSGFVGRRQPAEYGFKHFLPKPFTMHQLAGLIETLVSSGANSRCEQPESPRPCTH